jgi:hypothetical protein
LEQKFNENQSQQIEADEDPLVIGTLIKRLFNKMAIPLIPFELYDKIG